MKTKQDLIRRTLEKLMVLAAGQAPTAEDSATVDKAIVPVLRDLAFRGAYAFGDPDKIEDEASEHLADCLSVALAGTFGKPQDESLRLLAEGRLRDLQYVEDSDQPIRATYF